VSLVISAADLAAMRRHGEREYPHEACGLIGGVWEGTERQVRRLIPVANARLDSPRNRYLIEPEAFRQATDELGRTGLDVLGVYHSHPDHPAQPSAFDREHAWPRLSYVIVSVAGGKSGALKHWVLDDDRAAFHEEAVTINEGMTSWQSRY
jgi:proteasome lid subunit RPN8/RPN11